MPVTRFTIALFGAATPALADGTATWLWDVETQDGDAIVEPGETATVTLSLLMEPEEGFDCALSASIIDCLGGTNADAGTIVGWDYAGHLNELTGDLATTDGVNILNLHAGQLTAQTQPFVIDNPLEVYFFEWQPNEYVPLEVAYSTSSHTVGDGAVYVWEWPDGKDWHDSDSVLYPVTEAAIQFTVVPTPPLLLLFAIFTVPRHRSAPTVRSQ